MNLFNRKCQIKFPFVNGQKQNIENILFMVWIYANTILFFMGLPYEIRAHMFFYYCGKWMKTMNVIWKWIARLYYLGDI